MFRFEFSVILHHVVSYAACMCAFFNGIINMYLTHAAVGRQEGQRLQILIRVHLCMCCASAALRKYLSNQLLELELVFVTNAPLTLPFKNSHVETLLLHQSACVIVEAPPGATLVTRNELQAGRSATDVMARRCWTRGSPARAAAMFQEDLTRDGLSKTQKNLLFIRD